jgi:hypothetical protein
MTDIEVAKSHLRDHLASLIISPISEGFWSIQSSAKDLCERNKTPDQVIRTFQNMLTKIPAWSDLTLKTEVDRIQTVTKCSYLDDLIMGVFVAYMKSFASLQLAATSEISIDFDRPTLAKFIHELYIGCARKFWQVAYLFKTEGVSSEVQARCRQEIETIINQTLEQVIRSFLPWETITKKYFSTQSQPQPEVRPEPQPEPQPEPEEEKKVSFGENEEKEIEDESDDEEEEEAPPRLEVSEEDAQLQIDGEEEEVDPLKELAAKAEETLVLNM